MKINDRDFSLRKNNFIFEKVEEHTLNSIQDSDFVGITMASPNFEDVKHTADNIKNKFPDKKIIVGGPHPSLDVVNTMKKIKNIDFIVIGEGERTIVDLLANISSPQNVKGISYREKEKILVTEPRELISDLDDLPMPDWDSINMSYYTRPGRYIIRFLQLKTAHIFSSRGCPYKCDYCAAPRLFPKLRLHSADRVVAEIETLLLKYDINGIYFADDQFLADKKRAVDICNKIIEKGINKKIKWSVQIRANSADKDIFDLLKKAGCVQVEYGFESASQRMLDAIHKKEKVENYYRAVDISKKCGLRIFANLMVGLPGETKDDILKTSEFIMKIKPNAVGYNLLMPLPGTLIFEKFVENKEEYDFNEMDCFSPKFNVTNLTFEELSYFYYRIRREIVFPIYAWDYIKFNLISDPKWSLIYLYRLFKMMLFKPLKFANFFVFKNKNLWGFNN